MNDTLNVVCSLSRPNKKIDDYLTLNFSNGSEICKKKTRINLETRVNSTLGYINVTQSW